MMLRWRYLWWALFIILALWLSIDWARGQTVPATRIRFSPTTNLTPPSGFFNFYIDQATGLLVCRNDAGGSCLPAGGGGTFPQTKASIANEWLKSYDAGTGLFTSTQPAFSNISGSVTDAQVPNTITIDSAALATALAANGTNCTVGEAARGVDASGNAEGCFAPGGGSGITSLGGLSDAVQTFTSPDDTNVTLTISSAAANHAFTMGWTGTLAKARQHAATVYNDQANTYGAGFKQTITESTTTAGLNLNGVTADPSVLANGDVWRNTTSDSFKARVNGATKIFAFTDSSITGNAATATALAADPANCGATLTAQGITAAGVAEGCQQMALNTTATATQFFTAYNSTTGAFTKAQPAFTDISGTASDAQIPAAVARDTEVTTAVDNKVRRHATDCTGITTGVAGDICIEEDSERFFTCQPTAGGCDTAGEWIETPTPGGGGGAPTTAPYVMTAADGGTSAETVITPGEGMERRINETNSNGGPYTLDFDPNDPSYFWIREEFCGGLTTTGNIGDNGWTATNIGAAPVISYQGLAIPNLCVMRATTTATTAQGGSVSPGALQTLGNLSANTNWDMTWVFRINQTTLISFRIGLVAALNAIEPTGGIWVRFDTNLADAAFKVETRSASVSTVGGTTYTVDANFHKIRMRSTTAGQIIFTFDANADQTLSTNVPTVAMVPAVIVVNRTTTARSADVDFFAFKMRGMAR